MLVGRCYWELSGRKPRRNIKKSQTPSITTSDRDLRRAKFDLVLERQRWSQEEPWNGPYLPLGSSTPKMLKLINSKN
jgi:hypothetical protein